MAKRVAVIDIGSNSVRMVIYERTSRFAFHLLHEAKSKVRLSESAYQNGGYLQELPMQRTLEALREFLSITDSLKVKKTLCVATSALRDAPNKSDFLQKARALLGLQIKVIDGEKEAYYGSMACANLLPIQQSALTIDIGGGSTEFSIISRRTVSSTISLDLGTVRLKELFFDDNKIQQAISFIDEALEQLTIPQNASLIGIGGTFRAISNAIMAQTRYPLEKLHAFEMTPQIFQDFLTTTLGATNAKLKKIGIKNDRYDVIKPGTLILDRLFKKMQFTKIISSGVGVREGVFLSDLLRNSNHQFPQNFNPSVRFLLDTHGNNPTFSNQLTLLSKKIFDLTQAHLSIPLEYRHELAIAAKLYPIGNSIHYYSKNKHSYYLIQSALEYGYTHKQIVLIATLTRFAKKKLPSKEHSNEFKALLPAPQIVDSLSYILSCAIALLSHRPQNIDFDLSFKDATLRVSSTSPLYLAKEAIKKLDSIKRLKVEFDETDAFRRTKLISL